MFASFFNSFFGPVLKLSQPWPILIVSLSITLLITIVYKLMTDQEMMKGLKDDVKKLQKTIKEFKDDPKKMMEVQKEMMDKQLKMMSHSIKPTFITLIPIIIIFGWLSSTFVYEPILPGQEFSTTISFVEGSGGDAAISVPDEIELIDNVTKTITNDKVSWKLKGESGEWVLGYEYNNQSYTMNILITEDYGYKDVIKTFKNNVVNSIEIGYDKIIVLNIFGWKLGWFGSYIIFSIIFSLLLRKMMRLH